MEDRMKEMSRNAIVAKERLMRLSPQRNPHPQGESREFFNTSSNRQSQASAINSRPNTSEEAIDFYHSNDVRNIVYESVDLTKDYEHSGPAAISSLRSVINEHRNEERNEHGNIHIDVNRKQVVTVPDTLQSPDNSVHEVPKKPRREDFDFSIPFNESNILIKVMAPDGRTPINLTKPPASLLQETLQYTGEKRDSNAVKRVLFDEEAKASKFDELYVL